MEAKTPKEWTIRSATVEDIDDLVAMCHEHALYEKANYTFDGKKEALRTHLFGPDPACYCLVAETSSGLIGYTTYMKQFSTWDAYYYVYMCCLFLRPEARGLSIDRKSVV